jgi:hypothetical protein
MYQVLPIRRKKICPPMGLHEFDREAGISFFVALVKGISLEVVTGLGKVDRNTVRSETRGSSFIRIVSNDGSH